MAETGLNQNWMRDYDPLTAKYVESDLTGLAAGVNTFGYVGGNPISRLDPVGLTAEDVNVISQYISQNFPDIARRGGYEFGTPNSGANASTSIGGVTTLWAAIRCKKLSLDEFEQLFDTMLHESMHSTDPWYQVWWDSFWDTTANHQSIYNRV